MDAKEFQKSINKELIIDPTLRTFKYFQLLFLHIVIKIKAINF